MTRVPNLRRPQPPRHLAQQGWEMCWENQALHCSRVTADGEPSLGENPHWVQHSKKKLVLVIQNPVTAFRVGKGKLVWLGAVSEHLHTPVGITEVRSSLQALVWVLFMPNFLFKSTFFDIITFKHPSINKRGFLFRRAKESCGGGGAGQNVMHETGWELKEEQAEREQGAGGNGIREALVGWETRNSSAGLIWALGSGQWVTTHRSRKTVEPTTLERNRYLLLFLFGFWVFFLDFYTFLCF